MILKYAYGIVGLSLILMCENALALTQMYLGSDQCLGPDKISHQYGQHWVVTDPNWVISKENIYSVLTQLPADTAVTRTVAPYHVGFNLADVTCDYYAGTLILKRTYTEDNSPYPNANYIRADSNKKMGWHFFYHATTCTTTLTSLDVCNWDFSFGYNAVPLTTY